MGWQIGPRLLLIFAVAIVLTGNLVMSRAVLAQGDEGTATAATASAEHDATMLKAFLNAVDGSEPEFLPAENTLVMQEQQVSYISGLSAVQDFVVHIEFDSPYTPDETGWDVGFFFRFGGEGHYRFVVNSVGRWAFSIGTEEPLLRGEVDTVNFAEGESNTLDIVAVDNVGYAAINGDYVGTLDLSEIVKAGSLDFGTSFFENNYVEGAELPYRDFTIWSLDE
jgi:hypothetical protein